MIDLHGRTVVPGFGDSHIHAVSGGLAMGQCDVREGIIVGTYPDIVRRFADANPDLAWILGDGWYMADFPGGKPMRHALDRAVAERRHSSINRDGHSAWANSRALERAGVDGRDDGPAGAHQARRGRWRRSGTLHEAAVDSLTSLPGALRRRWSRACGRARRTCTASESPDGRTPTSMGSPTRGAYRTLAVAVG